jgi:sugar lactone lactonase YvrE
MKRVATLLYAVVIGTAGCTGAPDSKEESPAQIGEDTQPKLVVVATSNRQWTGLTMSRDGRLFVNFPRWSPDVPLSVAEFVDGQPVPYPDMDRNSWSPEGNSDEQFVCVQSVVADEAGSLWVLDPASPGLAGVVENGAKLMQFDLSTNELVRVFRYIEPIIKPVSYLNDVRVDLEDNVAYITDSGDGAIVVTDLETGESRRLLDEHPSTQAEDVVLTIEGEPWLPGGAKPQVHADGIALSPDRRVLYYQALTGRTLYRVATEALRDATLSAEELGERVEVMGTTGAADGLIFGADEKLYISALEESAIKRFDPETRDVEIVVQDEAIRWPDTFTRDAEGRILFTTAQIHLGPDVTEPFRIFRIE